MFNCKSNGVNKMEMECSCQSLLFSSETMALYKLNKSKVRAVRLNFWSIKRIDWTKNKVQSLFGVEKNLDEAGVVKSMAE